MVGSPFHVAATRPATHGSNACRGEDGFPRPTPPRCGRQRRAPGAARPPATSLSSTSRGEPRRARRRRWPRRRFRARLSSEPSPAGERTARVLAGYRRTAVERGRGQARPFGAADLAAVLATCHRRRRRGRGGESDQVAVERGRLDAVIAGLLFMAGMRRSEVSALRWAEVADAAAGDRMLVTVRPRQDEPGGRGEGRAVRERATSPAPSRRCGPPRARRPRTASCRSRRRWLGGGDSRRRPGRPASSR